MSFVAVPVAQGVFRMGFWGGLLRFLCARFSLPARSRAALNGAPCSRTQRQHWGSCWEPSPLLFGFTYFGFVSFGVGFWGCLL